jgi:hypothetical protein
MTTRGGDDLIDVWIDVYGNQVYVAWSLEWDGVDVLSRRTHGSGALVDVHHLGYGLPSYAWVLENRRARLIVSPDEQDATNSVGEGRDVLCVLPHRTLVREGLEIEILLLTGT